MRSFLAPTLVTTVIFLFQMQNVCIFRFICLFRGPHFFSVWGDKCDGAEKSVAGKSSWAEEGCPLPRGLLLLFQV